MTADILEFMDEKPKEESHPEIKEENTNDKPQNDSKGDFESNWDQVFEPMTIDPSALTRGINEYSAIGNSDTPNDILETMRLMSKKLSELDLTFRSNVNNDRDKLNSTAALGAGSKKAIYLPWGGFANDLITMADKEVYKWPTKESYQVATKYNNSFNKLKPVIRAFVARDISLILGRYCDKPIDFLLCWSIDGAEDKKTVSMKTGNIRNVIYLCNEFDIPVFNLGNENALPRFKQYIQTLNS